MKKERCSALKIIKISFVIVIGMAGMLYLYSHNALKVTDVNHPGFNPEKFKFTDYPDPNNLQAAIKSICRKDGATLADMDEAFVKSGKAEKRLNAGNILGVPVTYVRYFYPPGIDQTHRHAKINAYVHSAIYDTGNVITCYGGRWTVTHEYQNYEEVIRKDLGLGQNMESEP